MVEEGCGKGPGWAEVREMVEPGGALQGAGRSGGGLVTSGSNRWGRLQLAGERWPETEATIEDL